MKHGVVIPTPEQALKVRLCRGVRQSLVQWKGQPASSTSWEDLELFQHKYPEFQLEDKLLLEEGSDVMWGRKYERHLRKEKK
jgi:hypothetical protein